MNFLQPNVLQRPESAAPFGELDERVAKIISNLEIKGIRFQIYARNTSRRATTSKKRGRKAGANELQFLINAIIFGPKDLFDSVGEYLTKCRVHLQDPLHCERDVVYTNPHILSRTEQEIMTSSLQIQTAPVNVENVTAQENLFSKLSKDDHLSLTEAPNAVKTTLYR